jgi:hypothetical protein
LAVYTVTEQGGFAFQSSASLRTPSRPAPRFRRILRRLYCSRLTP